MRGDDQLRADARHSLEAVDVLGEGAEEEALVREQLDEEVRGRRAVAPAVARSG